MANKTISGFPVPFSLPVAAAINGTETLPLNQTVGGIITTASSLFSRLLGPVAVNYTNNQTTIGAASSGLSLTVNSNGALDTMALNGAGRFATLLFQSSATLRAQAFIDTSVNQFAIGTNTAGWSVIFKASNSVNAMILTGTAITGFGPVAGAQVDMTPDRGTFTLTHTGFTAAVTSTATWYRIGNLVTLNTGTVIGTSNATTWTATGLPAAIQVTFNQIITIGDAQDAGIGTAATAAVATGSGTIIFGKGFFSGGAWTATGAKGFGNTGGTTFSYLIG